MLKGTARFFGNKDTTDATSIELTSNEADAFDLLPRHRASRARRWCRCRCHLGGSGAFGSDAGLGKSKGRRSPHQPFLLFFCSEIMRNHLQNISILKFEYDFLEQMIFKIYPTKPQPHLRDIPTLLAAAHVVPHRHGLHHSFRQGQDGLKLRCFQLRAVAIEMLPVLGRWSFFFGVGSGRVGNCKQQICQILCTKKPSKIVKFQAPRSVFWCLRDLISEFLEDSGMYIFYLLLYICFTFCGFCSSQLRNAFRYGKSR